MLSKVSSFRFRKKVLAIADAFIVIIAGLIINFIFYYFDIYL